MFPRALGKFGEFQQNWGDVTLNVATEYTISYSKIDVIIQSDIASITTEFLLAESTEDLVLGVPFMDTV